MGSEEKNDYTSSSGVTFSELANNIKTTIFDNDLFDHLNVCTRTYAHIFQRQPEVVGWYYDELICASICPL